jgi:hypothetical protein
MRSYAVILSSYDLMLRLSCWNEHSISCCEGFSKYCWCTWDELLSIEWCGKVQLSCSLLSRYLAPVAHLSEGEVEVLTVHADPVSNSLSQWLLDLFASLSVCQCRNIIPLLEDLAKLVCHIVEIEVLLVTQLHLRESFYLIHDRGNRSLILLDLLLLTTVLILTTVNNLAQV